MPLIPKGQKEAAYLEELLGCKEGVLLSKDSPIDKEEIIDAHDTLQQLQSTFDKIKTKSWLQNGANFTLAGAAIAINQFQAGSLPVNAVFGAAVIGNYLFVQFNIASLDRLSAKAQEAREHLAVKLPRDFFPQ